MNRIKKLPFVLVLVMLLSSCDSQVSKEDTQNIASAETNDSAITESIESETLPEESISPNLPEMDFEGHNFCVLAREVSGWPELLANHIDIYAEGENGETINDAVFRRNIKVMDQYNFTIEQINKNVNDSSFQNALKGTVLAGDGAYDLMTIMPSYAVSILNEGYLYDLTDLEYIDLSAEWWNTYANECLTINDTLFYGFSDLIVMDENGTPAITFNKTIAENSQLGNLYDLVREGKWTLDAMKSLCEQVTSDTDGNGTITADDRLGFIKRADVPGSFYNGAGETIASFDKEKGQIVVNFENERSFAVTEKINELFKVCISGNCNEIFSDGRSLFNWEEVFFIIQLRANDLDFGVLPIPKYDEAQDRYYCHINNYGSCAVAIPSGVKDIDRVAIITEALTAESMNTLTPAYYDVVLNGKAVRDEESSEMLDIIFRDSIIDIGIFYDVGGFYSEKMLNMPDEWNPASAYAGFTKKMEIGIKRLNKSFGIEQ